MKNSLLYKTILLFIIIFAIIFVHKYKAENKTTTPDKPTIKIGAIFPLSGDSAVYGESAQAATQIFMDELSKIDTKYKYEIIFEDNRQKLSETVNIAKKFITYDKADVLITFLANYGMAVAPVAEEYKTPHFSVASVDPNIARGEYNFMIGPSLKSEMEQRIRIMKEENLKRVDMLVMNANGPKITYQTFVDMVNDKKPDIKIENVYDINPGEKDFRMIISMITENNPDLVIAEMQTPEMDVFIRQFREKSNIKLSGLLPFLIDKNLAEGSWFVDGANPSNFYFDSFKKITNTDTTNYSEYFYAALQIIVNTYENSEQATPQSFIDLSENFDTVLGKVSFDKDGVLNSEATVKRIKNGQVILDK